MTLDKQQIANRFAEVIRAKRLQYGWSYYEMSKRTGIHATELIHVESGRHCPRLDTCIKICDALCIRLRLPDMVLE